MTENGRILKGLGGLYDVKLTGGETVSCLARGIIKHDNLTLAVGDYVSVEIAADGTASIQSIIDRRNLLIRPPIANLDILYTVIAAEAPEPVLTTVDKLISIAEFNEIEPIIIITKSDLNAEKSEYLADIYKKSNFKVFIGTDALDNFIETEAKDKTAAFAGASGVGKSTLLNKLFPKRLTLETNQLSRKTSRGRHTTRHVELFPLAYLTANQNLTGYLADTPGFSLLDFTRFDFYDKDDLPFTFREFQPYLTKCKYTKCTHTKEEGCVIIEAVKEGLISNERHNSYIEIYNDIKDKRDWMKNQ